MSIYKDCDIRGIYRKEFDESDAYLIGRAIGTLHTGKKLAVGGDVRLSTPVLKLNLIRGLLDSGALVWDLGMVPTPAFYFALKALDMDGGVMVTASHNPAEHNGFKLMFGQWPVTPEEILQIESLVQSRKFTIASGQLFAQEISREYRAARQAMFQPVAGIPVVLDCCNGATGALAPAIFRDLGYTVHELFCTFDGRFPNRDPNPAKYSCLQALCKTVRDTGAAFGAAFDGDGDRVVFVDDQGQVVQSEQALVLLIQHCLKDAPGPVVYDQKASSIVKSAIAAAGGEPLMERSGHAFIKRTFLEHHAPLAGEISGHFFFGELGYDDGIYAALKLGELLSTSNSSLSQLVAQLPHPLITPDIRVFCPYAERDTWLEQVKALGQTHEMHLLDGVRIEFSDGWLLVRKSVTEESLTIRIEAENDAAMTRIQTELFRVLPQVQGMI
jgi:phosphomannomutase/phosphoglucomutase